MESFFFSSYSFGLGKDAKLKPSKSTNDKTKKMMKDRKRLEQESFFFIVPPLKASCVTSSHTDTENIIIHYCAHWV